MPSRGGSPRGTAGAKGRALTLNPERPGKAPSPVPPTLWRELAPLDQLCRTAARTLRPYTWLLDGFLRAGARDDSRRKIHMPRSGDQAGARGVGGAARGAQAMPGAAHRVRRPAAARSAREGRAQCWVSLCRMHASVRPAATQGRHRLRAHPQCSYKYGAMASATWRRARAGLGISASWPGTPNKPTCRRGSCKIMQGLESLNQASS